MKERKKLNILLRKNVGMVRKDNNNKITTYEDIYGSRVVKRKTLAESLTTTEGKNVKEIMKKNSLYRNRRQ